MRSGARGVAGLLLAVAGLVGCSAAEEAPLGEPAGTTEVRPSATALPTPPASAPGETAERFPEFSAGVRQIGPRLRERMRFSHRPGCPVALRDLRYLRLSVVSFGGLARTGEIVVHESHASAVTEVFRTLYEARWPIRRMRLVDDYRGNDELSMAANNTSGYNCRLTAGGERWSEHSYGRAIDINPVQNPYVVGSDVSPEQGRRYARIDRFANAPALRGVILARDVAVSAFAEIGWTWGGDWVYSKDYQHFSATGG